MKILKSFFSKFLCLRTTETTPPIIINTTKTKTKTKIPISNKNLLQYNILSELGNHSTTQIFFNIIRHEIFKESLKIINNINKNYNINNHSLYVVLNDNYFYLTNTEKYIIEKVESPIIKYNLIELMVRNRLNVIIGIFDSKIEVEDYEKKYSCKILSLKKRLKLSAVLNNFSFISFRSFSLNDGIIVKS